MKKTVTIILMISLLMSLKAQLVINEVSSSNKSNLFDEDWDAKSWIELYNNSTSPIDLSNYFLSNSRSNLSKFRLPNRILASHDYQLIYASNKNRGAYQAPVTTHHWETAVKAGDSWRYNVATLLIPSNWTSRGFNDSSWPLGKSGFGYGDGDDSTLISSCFAVYMRYKFSIADTSKIADAVLHMDYDDGFIAYLNGTEIARVSLIGTPPAWNEGASGDHEAILYGGASAPDAFVLNTAQIKRLIQNGFNDLTIEVHNTDTSSDDITAIPYFSLLVKNGTSYFGAPPSWFPTIYSGNIHSNFQISNLGQSVYLSNLSLSMVDSMALTRLNTNESYGRYTDGLSTKRFFDAPSPGYSNNFSAVFTAHEIPPIIIRPSGMFTAAQVVSIINNSTTGGVIRYTLNGQDPTASSPLYTVPITISTTSIVKARCFNSASILPSTMDVRTFVINDSFTVPVYSITADSSDLWGWPGIIDNPWSDYRVPCHIDIFGIDKSLIASQNSSIRIDGGAGGSRGNPQRSFRMDFDNSNFGDGIIREVLIPEKPSVAKYSSIYLRNGSNFWNSIFFKEGFMERVSREDTFAIYNAYRPVVVLLNGEYFGLYELREKYTDAFMKYNYGADKDSVDILSVSYSTGAGIIRTLDGSDFDWYQAHHFIMNLDTASPSFIQDVNTVLDSRNFSDYMAIENYWANYDWVWNNMKLIRAQNLDNRWKFALQDMEWGFAGWGNYWDDMFGYTASNIGYTYVNIYDKLLHNQKSRNFFINRYADLLNTDMLPDTMKSIFKVMWNEAIPEWNRQILRWQDPDTANLTTHIDEYKDLRTRFSEFMDLRPDVVRTQLRDNFRLVQNINITLNVEPPNTGNVRISTVTPPYYPWTGIYFDGNSVDLEAKAKPGYAFAYWDTSSFIADTSAISFASNVTYNTTFTAHFMTAPIDTTVDTNVSIKAVRAEETDIEVYPNPSSDITYVIMPFDGEKTILIYSNTGALIDSRKSQARLAMLDAKMLSKGIYYLKVISSTGTLSKKFVVN